MEDWYPEKMRVSDEGTKKVYYLMTTLYDREEYFNYAEIGSYEGNTAKNVCELFPNATLYLFDYTNVIEKNKEKLKQYEDRIHYFDNTQKYNDSYNWSLMKLIMEHRQPIFDFIFMDGAHTFAIDGLCFFLCDKLLKDGGFIYFDDYDWKIRGSSLDPAKVPVISEQYTDEQIDTFQVKLIVDELVRRDWRYNEITPNKVFQKCE